MALTKNTDKKWEGVVGAINGSGTVTVGELQTAGTYVDANIVVKATVAAAELQSVAGNAPVATAGLADTTYLTTTNTGYPITATADAAATSKSSVDAVKTAGWVPANGSVTVTTPAATQASTTKYIKSGSLSKGAGSASATGTNIAITESSSQPSSGAYITVTGSGSVGVGTAGWIPTTATETSNTATKYYTVTGATLKNTATSGKTYTEIDAASNENVIIPSGGYLYIDGGAIGNTKISLATLVPDGATIAETATGKSDKMRGISAYDKDGKLIAGSMPDAVLSTSGSISAVSMGTKSDSKYPVSVTGSTSASTTTTGYAVKDTTSATGSISSTAQVDAITLSASGSVTAVSVGTKSSGQYPISVTGSASAGVATAGYGKNETATGTISSTAKMNAATLNASGSVTAVGFTSKDANTYNVTVTGSASAGVATEGYAKNETGSGTITSTATVAKSTHSIAANGTATVTNATLNNTQAATGTLNSAAITPVTYTTQTAAGSNYVKVTATAAQATAGSISSPVKCTSTAGYTEGTVATYSVTGSVGVTSKTGDIYFKVYNGEIVTAQ